MNRIIGEWANFIDKREAELLLPKLIGQYISEEVNPNMENVYKAFKIIKPNECRVVFIGQDPYPQRGKATGIVFANKEGTPEEDYSPSLKVIKNSIKNLENPNLVYTFDPTLENWARQGILMLNASLTTRVNEVGSHIMMWRGFMTKFISNISRYENMQRI